MAKRLLRAHHAVEMATASQARPGNVRGMRGAWGESCVARDGFSTPYKFGAPLVLYTQSDRLGRAEVHHEGQHCLPPSTRRTWPVI